MDEADDEQIEREQPVVSNARKTLTTFPFSKTTCVCNCGKFDLAELPHLQKILPDNYEYKVCEYLPLDREDKFLVTLRMAMSSEDEALEWKRHFEAKSLITHVKDKTFPKVARVSVFKAQYRCQFFDRRKNKKKLPEKSKFRDCHSILFINIKKYFKNTVDKHMPTYNTVVRLHYAHDHPLDTTDILKKRQLNEDIKERFLEMFRQGMKPKDALDKHKRELLLSLGPEKYRQVVCDGYYVPNVPKAYRLYYQVHGKGVSAKTTTKRSSRHNPNPDWIAFQDWPDAAAMDDDNAGDKDEEADDDDVECTSDGEDKDTKNAAAQNEDIRVEQSQPGSNMACPAIMDQHVPHGNLDPIVRDTEVPHNLPSSQSMVPKPPVNDSGVTANSMMHHDGQLQKLADTAIAYPNIAAHNSVYTDLRNQNLPPQGMPVSSFGDVQMNMGLFNPHQPTWENFSLAHQQTMVPHIPPPQHSMGFQDLGHQHVPPSYMNLPSTSCQNVNTHYVSSQSMIDPSNIGHQNSARITTDLHVIGPNTNPQYSWTPNRPLQNITTSQLQPNSNDVRRGKSMPSNNTSTMNQVVKKAASKKAAQRKRNQVKELNMKHVTKRWIEKKTKVEAETQNLASEVMQNILLTDEAEKLKVKLLTFLSDLESKMTFNPKVFVPAIRNFLRAGEGVQDDAVLASFLKDFGKTEEHVLQNQEKKKGEMREHRSTQTKLSGPVVRLGNVRSKQSGSSRKTSGITRKRTSRAASTMTAAEPGVGKKRKITRISSKLTEQFLQCSESECTSGMSRKAKKITSEQSQDEAQVQMPAIISRQVHEHHTLSSELMPVSKKLRRPSKKSCHVIKEKKNYTSKEKQKRSRLKINLSERCLTKDCSITHEECPSSHGSLDSLKKRLVVKLPQVRKVDLTLQQEKNDH